MTQEEFNQVLEASYCAKGTFQHRKAKLIRLFPYVTTNPPISVEDELSSYNGIGSIIARKTIGVQACKDLSLDLFEQNLRSKVVTTEFDHLFDIVKVLSFDENGQISPFALSAIPYLDFLNNNPTLRELGAFLYDIFLSKNGSLKELAKFNSDVDENVLHSLIHKSLPELGPVSESQNLARYFKIEVGLDSVFEKDWKFLCSHPALLHSYYFDFFKIYSLLYQLRSVEQLNKLFSNDMLKPIYFTLEWESCAASRLAYQAGWKRIEPQLSALFSHINCLEMINHITLEGLSAPFSYEGLAEWCTCASSRDKDQFELYLQFLMSFYREKISTLSNGPKWDGWEAYEPFESNEYDEKLLSLTTTFFKMVDCQFRNSQRSAPASKYASWLIKFVITNFSKRRGRIGYTLAFTKEQILFITRLVVGDKTKLRLHSYWEELESRGVAFDYESRRKIVEFFERLNLLEKKSDSGDAQYVRSLI